MEPTNKKEEAAAARAPKGEQMPKEGADANTRGKKRPKGRTGEEPTGFSSFPRRALIAPRKKTRGTVPLHDQEETRGGGKRKLTSRGKPCQKPSYETKLRACQI